LFSPFKKKLRGKKFNGNDGVKENVLNLLRYQDKDFFAAGNKLIKRWDKCINVAGDYVEKKIKLIK